MNNEFVKEWLEWVINFVQMDISKLSTKEKNDFSQRKEKYDFFQKFNWFAGPHLFDTSFDPFGKRSQFSQNQIKTLEETIAPEIQNTLKQFIDQMTMIRASYELPELTSFIRSEGTMTRDPRVYFQTHSIPKHPTPKNWAILNLSRLLQGLEMHVIGKCKECQRYFLNFSLREKIYCSPQCASRDLARTRQERWGAKDYDAYKKKQRRYAKRHYEEKRKAQGKKVKHRHAPARRQKKSGGSS